MKITLAVLFLAGLTIYCKCAAVLSLPPSLIAHAASLERTQTPKSFPTDNGKAGNHVEDSTAAVVDGVDEVEDADGDGDGSGGIRGGVDSTVLYKNFKNLWQKNFGIRKRERNAFEDNIAAVVAAASTPQMQLQTQQHGPIAAIKNNKNALKVVAAIPRQQQQHLLHQQQRPDDNGNNNFLNTKLSATNKPLEHSHPYLRPLELAEDAQEYDSNKWQSTATGPQMLDSIFVSPPHGSPIIEDNRNDDGDDTMFVMHQPTHSFIPETRQGNDYVATVDDTSAVVDASDDSPDPVVWSKFLRPVNYWPIECQGENEKICPQAYYSALIADRSNALSQYLPPGKNINPFTINLNPLKDTSYPVTLQNSSETLLPSSYSNDDIVLLLTAEQKLIQFLSWALAELYPFGKLTNVSENNADSYHPGMYLWKIFNSSGRLEPPLLVEEPHYVTVRREYEADENDKRDTDTWRRHADPFIPPRGRKHNLPDLDALLQRYETFVPNRGRRDKIKDIFKYDDLFYPNRGKRQMTLATTDNGYYNDDADTADDDADDNINIKVKQQQQQQQLAKGENVAASLVQMQLQQNPLAKTLEHIQNVMAKLKRKLHQIQLKREQQQKNLANTFDEMMSNKKPTTRMSTTYQPPQQHTQQLNKRLKSTVNILQQQRMQHTPNNKNSINSRRQWWKRYSTMDDNDRPAATSTRSRTMAANRLHALRSMSPQQQQQQELLLLEATSAMPHHRQQQQHTPAYISPPHLYQANKFMWQPPQQFQLRQPTPATALTQQFDPLSGHKLQMLQHQYHLPLLTMRHPHLTAQQHLTAAMQPHFGGNDDEQLATPQETQLPQYSSIDSIYSLVDNTVANYLKNLYTIDSD